VARIDGGRPPLGVIDVTPEDFEDPDESPETPAEAANLLRQQARDALAKLIRL
jgi:hypothetical protein